MVIKYNWRSNTNIGTSYRMITAKIPRNYDLINESLLQDSVLQKGYAKLLPSTSEFSNDNIGRYNPTSLILNSLYSAESFLNRFKPELSN